MSTVCSLSDCGELTTGMIVELGLRMDTSVEVSNSMSTSESHLGILLNVAELCEVEKHCV